MPRQDGWYGEHIANRPTVDLTASAEPVLDLLALAVAPDNDGPRPRVLIVDDEPDVRGWIRVALEIQGWDVDEAASAEDALDAVSHCRPDVVVLDRMLPGADGITCAGWLRARHPGLRLLLFSAYLDAASSAETEAIGLDAISKVDHASFFRVLAAHRDELVARTVAAGDAGR